LKKGTFRWSPEVEAPVLHLPAFEEAFVVECDASGTGFGAVLHEGRDPITFFSWPIVSCHAKLAAYERELIWLVQAVWHWRPYLWGRTFVVRTNHYSLKFLLNQRLSTILQHHRASKLLGFDFSVEYKPGATNVVVDALSRCHGDKIGEVMAISALTFQIFDDLLREIDSDPELLKLKQDVEVGDRGAA
jgi:hypothetical protein